MKNCVVFVGDSPSKTNVRADVAFVGAKCFQRLCDWIAAIKPTYYVCYNSDTTQDIQRIYDLQRSGFTVVALGQVASNRLFDFDIPHLGLPHPSGLNRQINDVEFVQKQLTLIKQSLEASNGN